MRKEIFTKLYKNEITVEEAEKMWDNAKKLKKLNRYLNTRCPVKDPEVIQAVINHDFFEFDKNDVDIDRLDMILSRYKGKYVSVEAFAKEYWEDLLNILYTNMYMYDFKTKYNSDVSLWIKAALASGELRVVPLGNEVLIFVK